MEPQGLHQTPLPHFAAVLGVLAEMTSFRRLSNLSVRPGQRGKLVVGLGCSTVGK